MGVSPSESIMLYGFNSWRMEWQSGWDTNLKLEFHRALVWNSAQHGNPSRQPLAATHQPAAKDTGAKATRAKPGTKS